MAAPPAVVWSVLADGWSYPCFVVGASSMRSVDAAWPAAGSVLHHSVGAWPVLINDSTTVRACQELRRLELVARAWPAGEALVVFEVAAASSGSLITMHEEPLKGPGTLVPVPVQELLLGARNEETLRRLDHLAGGRFGAPPTTSEEN